jgi:hypothetical protein
MTIVTQSTQLSFLLKMSDDMGTAAASGIRGSATATPYKAGGNPIQYNLPIWPFDWLAILSSLATTEHTLRFCEHEAGHSLASLSRFHFGVLSPDTRC